MKNGPVHISTIVESILSNYNLNVETMAKGIDESTRTNAFGSEEYDFHPQIGTYKKLPPKKNQADNPEREVKSSFSFTETEWYHDQNGILKQKTRKS